MRDKFWLVIKVYRTISVHQHEPIRGTQR